MLKYLNVFCSLGKEGLYYLYHKDYNLWMEKTIYHISNMNILYIKIFQSLAYNNKLIDDTICQHIRKFTNNVPYDKSDIDNVLLSTLKNQYDLCFETYNPINSGVISLIFKVKNKDGKDIILKMKRKNIDIKLNESIEEIAFFIKILYLFPFIKKLKIKETFYKNIFLLKEQLNFDLEVKNIQHFQKNFSNIDYVVIPYVYPELTIQHPNVIMMEYLQGKELHEIDITKNSIYSKLILKMSIITFLSGCVHGDLHSGNILFLEGEKPKICLFDFGIVLKIDKNMIMLFINIIDDLYEKDAIELSVYLLEIIIHNFQKLKELKYHYENLINIIAEIIHNVKIKNNKYNIFHYFQCLQMVIKYMDKHQLNKEDIYLKDDFYKLNLCFFMASCIITKLCDTELFLIINDVCNELFQVNF